MRERLAIVETRQDGLDERLDRIEGKVDKIYDLLIARPQRKERLRWTGIGAAILAILHGVYDFFKKN